VSGVTGSTGASGSQGIQGVTGATGATGTLVVANIIGDGGSGRQWSDGTYARSCYFYKYPPNGYSYAGLTGDGIYTVDADGPIGNAPFRVYCDMTNQDGGWTLAVGIAGNSVAHINYNAVSPGNLTAAGGKGKFSDAVINNLKSGISPSYRFTCANTTAFFSASCEFVSVLNASGACVAEGYGYPPPTYGSGRYVQSQIVGLGDGDNGTNDRLLYGDTQINGCDTAATGWGQNGAVWVR
jgi:hypothetical protein